MSKEMTLELFDPRNDFVFKNIFGNEKYLDILKDFLEAILELPKGKEIVSVELKNPNNDK